MVHICKSCCKNKSALLFWDIMYDLDSSDFRVRPFVYMRLATGNVQCVCSATYQIFFRLSILNPNPITDPNPKPKNKRKQNDTWIKFNIELYLKVNFIGQGVGL